MARKAKENQEHAEGLSKYTSTPTYKRPTRERGPFGENMGTVQREHINEHVKKRKSKVK